MATRNDIRDRVHHLAKEGAERAKHVWDEMNRRTPQVVKDAYERTAPRVREAYEETAPRLRDAYRRFHRSAPAPVGKALDVAEDAVDLARRRIARRIERSAPDPDLVPPPGRDATTPSHPATSRSSASRLQEATKGELYERAKALEIPGRSKMSKDELVQAIASRSS